MKTKGAEYSITRAGEKVGEGAADQVSVILNSDGV